MLQLMVLFILSQTVYQHRVQPMAETHVQVSTVGYSNCDDGKRVQLDREALIQITHTTQTGFLFAMSCMFFKIRQFEGHTRDYSYCVPYTYVHTQYVCRIISGHTVKTKLIPVPQTFPLRRLQSMLGRISTGSESMFVWCIMLVISTVYHYFLWKKIVHIFVYYLFVQFQDQDLSDMCSRFLADTTKLVILASRDAVCFTACAVLQVIVILLVIAVSTSVVPAAVISLTVYCNALDHHCPLQYWWHTKRTALNLVSD